MEIMHEIQIDYKSDAYDISPVKGFIFKATSEVIIRDRLNTHTEGYLKGYIGRMALILVPCPMREWI